MRLFASILTLSSLLCSIAIGEDLKNTDHPAVIEANVTTELDSNFEQNPFEESNQPGSVIKALGLMVNLEDFNHFESVIKESFRLLQKTNSRLDHVYAVGITREPQKLVPLLMGISLWGGEFQRANTIPEKYEKYKITRSPVWIVETEKGEILIEGRDSIRKFLNRQGEFVTPENGAVPIEGQTVQASAESVEPDRNDLFGAE